MNSHVFRGVWERLPALAAHTSAAPLEEPPDAAAAQSSPEHILISAPSASLQQEMFLFLFKGALLLFLAYV